MLPGSLAGKLLRQGRLQCHGRLGSPHPEFGISLTGLGCRCGDSFLRIPVKGLTGHHGDQDTSVVEEDPPILRGFVDHCPIATGDVAERIGEWVVRKDLEDKEQALFVKYFLFERAYAMGVDSHFIGLVGGGIGYPEMTSVFRIGILPHHAAWIALPLERLTSHLSTA